MQYNIIHEWKAMGQTETCTVRAVDEAGRIIDAVSVTYDADQVFDLREVFAAPRSVIERDQEQTLCLRMARRVA
jgi:hypothetical protein